MRPTVPHGGRFGVALALLLAPCVALGDASPRESAITVRPLALMLSDVPTVTFAYESHAAPRIGAGGTLGIGSGLGVTSLALGGMLRAYPEPEFKGFFAAVEVTLVRASAGTVSATGWAVTPGVGYKHTSDSGFTAEGGLSYSLGGMTLSNGVSASIHGPGVLVGAGWAF